MHILSSTPVRFSNQYKTRVQQTLKFISKMFASRYGKLIARSTSTVKCVHCWRTVAVKNYRYHLRVQHLMSIGSRQCVWCNNYKWECEEEDKKGYEHCVSCLYARLRRSPDEQPNDESANVSSPPPPPLTVRDVEFNCLAIHDWLKYDKLTLTMAPLVESKHCLTSAVDPSFLQPTGYELSLDMAGGYFDERTNIDARFVLGFDDGDFYYDYITVRESEWLVFMQLLAGGVIRLLPYWCCCSCGQREHHRHMVMVYQKTIARFVHTAWIRFTQTTPMAGADSLKSRVCILNREHLINVMVNVSQPRAIIMDGCEYTRCPDRLRNGSCHYMIAKPMPPHAALFFSLVYRGGLEKWINARFANASAPFEHVVRDPRTGKWNACLRHLSTDDGIDDDIRGVVVPLKRLWTVRRVQMGDRKIKGTGSLFHLTGANALEIVRCVGHTLMTRAQWIQNQLINGNVLLDSVIDQPFELGTRQQEILDAVDKNVTSIRAEMGAIIMEKEAIITQLRAQAKQ